MAEAPALVELESVTKRFAAAAGGAAPEPLRSVDLRVARGETVAIVGPSGSGKTTLLQILGGLQPPTSGHVRLDGRDLFAGSEDERARIRNQQIGFIFQRHHLLPQCSVLENVLVPTLAAHARVPEAAVERARALLEQVGLADRQDHRPGQLSGGESQRAAVARALIQEPPLVLADEPTGSLDARTAEGLAELLVSLNRERGTTLITVTHSPDLAGRMGRQLTLREGRLS